MWRFLFRSCPSHLSHFSFVLNVKKKKKSIQKFVIMAVDHLCLLFNEKYSLTSCIIKKYCEFNFELYYQLLLYVKKILYQGYQ